MSEVLPAQASDYMFWARTRQSAPFNLAVSGVPALTTADLPLSLADVGLTGPSTYGWPPLQAALARHLGVTGDRVVHAGGTSMANHLAMAVCLQPGDEVLVEEPTYDCLVDVARYLRASIRRFPRPRALGFQPDLAALRAAFTPATRLVVLTNLHNPSGTRLENSTLATLSNLCLNAGARMLVDEVYLDAAAEPPPPTAHRLGDHVLTTSSLTKIYGLNGLRCGWVLAAPGLAHRMARLNDLFGVIPAHPAETLSLAALPHLPALRRRALELIERNRTTWKRFVQTRTNLEDSPSPVGTTVFPRLLRGSVDTLCKRLRETYQTTVVPGRFFSSPDSFRVGLGCPEATFHEGLRRLGLAHSLADSVEP